MVLALPQVKNKKGGIDDVIKISILHEFTSRYTDRPNRTRFRCAFEVCALLGVWLTRKLSSGAVTVGKPAAGDFKRVSRKTARPFFCQGMAETR